MMETTAIVTGGARGIGRAIARAFLDRGDRVLIVDADETQGRMTLRELEPFGDIHFLAGDVSEERTAEDAVRLAASRFGRLDILVNNAAISRNGPITELSLQDWNRVIGVNLTGAFLFAKHAAPLLSQGGGSIVNLCSTRALMSEPGTEAYSASKGGILALTHALAMSLAPRVRVNAVSPGWIDTRAGREENPPPLSLEDHRQHPAGRVGEPGDIARLVLFLTDPANGFITGADFVADGGMTRKMIYTE